MNLAESVVEFKDVKKSYKDVQALKGISFSIRKGEIFGYLGPNGAGKTTTIKILVGLIRKYSGSIFIDGEPIDYGEHGFHRILGYLPQDVGFQEWRTVEHALKTFGKLSGLDSKFIREHIPNVLELVTLEDVRKKKISKLSGGMKQKLLLAQAMLHDPEILVLDEPMTGLDPLSRFQLKKVFKRLSKDEGKTLFFSSHVLSDVEGICNTLGVLDYGKIIKISNPKDLEEEYRLLMGDIVEVKYFNDAPIVKDVEDLDVVEKVEVTDDKRHLIYFKSGGNLDEKISKALSILVEHGSKIRNFNLVSPSLDDVYVQLIGGEQRLA
ncbi:MAG: ABC transporter ATP-binding protein [Candidatus Lokiarchaeota archaeon]|nr:ABC transporter ATP-binding protein [Candidatus Lokiarchaeota archaeon]